MRFDKPKQKVHTIDKHPSDCAMTCVRSISYFVNTLNKIHLNSKLFDEFSRELYNDKNYVFNNLFS